MSPLSEYNDWLASKYEQASRAGFGWRAPQVVAQLLATHGVHPKRVLDLGVGTGDSIASLHDEPEEAVGLDISEEMLARARERFPRHAFLHWDLEDGLPADLGEPYDAVLAVGVLEFVRSLSGLFLNVRQHLASDGTFAFTTEALVPKSHFQKTRSAPLAAGLIRKVPPTLAFRVLRRTPEEISALLKATGLEVVAQVRFEAYSRTSTISGLSELVQYDAFLAKEDRASLLADPHSPATRDNSHTTNARSARSRLR